MTDAQKVAAHYRRKAGLCAEVSPYGDKSPQAAELNAIADVVEAGERMTAWRDKETYSQMLWRTALAKLAKAVGVEGENNG